MKWSGNCDLPCFVLILKFVPDLDNSSSNVLPLIYRTYSWFLVDNLDYFCIFLDSSYQQFYQDFFESFLVYIENNHVAFNF